jgi:hypothetical protein
MNKNNFLAILDENHIVFDADRSRWLSIFQKLDAARTHISRAITLYLDDEDFLCAITLSGAAHTLLNEGLIEEYNLDPLGTVASMIAYAETGQYQKKNFNLERRKVINAERHAVYWLKHYGEGKGNPPEQKAFDPEDFAMTIINHSIYDYGLFVSKFAASASIDVREKVFGTSQIIRWLEYWDMDANIFDE